MIALNQIYIEGESMEYCVADIKKILPLNPEKIQGKRTDLEQ